MFFDDPYYPLTIDGVSPNTSAWFLEDPQELFQPRQYAEVNIDQPGVPGKLPRDMIVEQRTVDLHWSMTGSCEPDGTPIPDTVAGLARNKRLFEAAYPFGQVADIAASDPDDMAVAGSIQLGSARFVGGLHACGVIVTCVIPEGYLEPTGS